MGYIYFLKPISFSAYGLTLYILYIMQQEGCGTITSQIPTHQLPCAICKLYAVGAVRTQRPCLLLSEAEPFASMIPGAFVITHKTSNQEELRIIQRRTEQKTISTPFGQDFIMLDLIRNVESKTTKKCAVESRGKNVNLYQQHTYSQENSCWLR